MLAPVGLVAGKQDLVMRPLHGLDAVHLHEADVVDELQQPGLGQRPVGRSAEALLGEENAAGIGIGNEIRHGPS
jgi:hypothetical protein